MAGHYDLRHEQIQRDNARIIAHLLVAALDLAEVYNGVFLAVALKDFPTQAVEFFLGQPDRDATVKAAAGLPSLDRLVNRNIEPVEFVSAALVGAHGEGEVDVLFVLVERALYALDIFDSRNVNLIPLQRLRLNRNPVPRLSRIRKLSCVAPDRVRDAPAAVVQLHLIVCTDNDSLAGFQRVFQRNLAGIFVDFVCVAADEDQLALGAREGIFHGNVREVALACVFEGDRILDYVARLELFAVTQVKLLAVTVRHVVLIERHRRHSLVVKLQDILALVFFELQRKDVILVLRIELIAFIMLCVVPLQILDSYRIANISLQSNTGICRGSYIRGLRIIAVGILPVILN